MRQAMSNDERNLRIRKLCDELDLITRFDLQCNQNPTEANQVAFGSRARQFRTAEILEELNQLRSRRTSETGVRPSVHTVQ